MMPNYPENTVWYIEARPWDGPKDGEAGFARVDPINRGSGVVISLIKTLPGGQREPRSYILTCAHVVRDDNDQLLEDIVCYPAGAGYIRTAENTRRCGTFPNTMAEAAKVSKHSPCQGELGARSAELKNDRASDWVLLEIEDPSFYYQPAIGGLHSGVNMDAMMFHVIGYPFGAGTVLEKLQGEGNGNAYPFWEDGKLVSPRTAQNFRPIMGAAPGLLDYEGSEETRPGMSGGGLFDTDGKFIGIHLSHTDSTMTRSAILAEVIVRTLQDVHALEFAPRVQQQVIPKVVIIREGEDAGSIISNIDQQLIMAAWTSNTVKEIIVDLPWNRNDPLITAVLRIALHQNEGSRLKVRNASAWNERIHKYADTWIALEQFNPTEKSNISIELQTAAVGTGNPYSSSNELARSIHSLCDLFILNVLNNRLDIIFEATNPRDHIGFHIADDVKDEMIKTWDNWNASLEKDPELLHHFLALMLTENGAHDITKGYCPGAGPLTIEDCILPATVFSLAITPFLPNAMGPKHPLPGNLSSTNSSGHSCGINAVKRTRLDSALKQHQWSTDLVLLQHVRQSPMTWQISTDPLTNSSQSPRPSLTSPSPAGALITRDEETEAAIGKNIQELTDHLSRRDRAHTLKKNNYVSNATPRL
ncbi:ABC-three component system protein [Coraliomargarita sp. W4R53]